jgi:putative NADH-flavin reductase
MNIVVFGITGFAGSAIAAELVARGHTVTGVARSLDEPLPRAILGLEGSLHDLSFVKVSTFLTDAIVVAIPAREVDGESLAATVPGLLDLAGPIDLRIGFVGGAGSAGASGAETEAQAAVLDALLGAAASRAEKRAEKPADWFYASTEPRVSGGELGAAIADELEHAVHHRERFTVGN